MILEWNSAQPGTPNLFLRSQIASLTICILFSGGDYSINGGFFIITLIAKNMKHLIPQYLGPMSHMFRQVNDIDPSYKEPLNEDQKKNF